jgi:hypothetical protein
MAATLGALLLMTMALFSASRRDGQTLMADHTPFQMLEPAAADGEWDVPLLAMTVVREAIARGPAAPQSDAPSAELGPLAREVVHQAEGPPIMPAHLTAAVVLELAASRSALVARPDEPLAGQGTGVCQPNGGRGGLGTRVAFEASPPDAFARARDENKLVFVIHLAGNLEDPGFT